MRSVSFTAYAVAALTAILLLVYRPRGTNWFALLQTQQILVFRNRFDSIDTLVRRFVSTTPENDAMPKRALSSLAYVNITVDALHLQPSSFSVRNACKKTKSGVFLHACKPDSL